MSRLLNLYPSAWQERYREELLDLLAEHPPTWRDRFDLVLGALDARLNPQVHGRPAASERDLPGPRTVVVSVGALIGGALWIAGGLAMNAAPFGAADGYRESAAATLILAMAALVSALAAIGLAALTSIKGLAWVAIGAIALIRRWPTPIRA
jgi:hypothetical protein